MLDLDSTSSKEHAQNGHAEAAHAYGFLNPFGDTALCPLRF